MGVGTLLFNVVYVIHGSGKGDYSELKELELQRPCFKVHQGRHQKFYLYNKESAPRVQSPEIKVLPIQIARGR